MGDFPTYQPPKLKKYRGRIPRFARITRDVETWKERTLTVRAMFSDGRARLVRGSPAKRWKVLDLYGDLHRCRLYPSDREALNAEWFRLRRIQCAALF
jgi:hypothetical protein